MRSADEAAEIVFQLKMHLQYKVKPQLIEAICATMGSWPQAYHEESVIRALRE
jgi:hypothetical protein